MAFATCFVVFVLLFLRVPFAYASVIPFYNNVVTHEHGEYKIFIKRLNASAASLGGGISSHTASALATALIIAALAVGLIYAFIKYRSWSQQHRLSRGIYRESPPSLRGRPTAGGMIFSRSTIDTLPPYGHSFAVPNTPAVPHYIGHTHLAPLASPTPTYSPGGRFAPPMYSSVTQCA